MPYYIRVLGERDVRVPVAKLHAALRAKKLQAELSVEDGTAGDWKQVLLKHTTVLKSQ